MTISRCASSRTAFKMFNRYSLDLGQSFALSQRRFGWQWVAAKILLKYWLDIRWRMKTRRDRRATMGASLIAGLRRELNRRGVPVLLNTGLERLDVAGGRVVGVGLSCRRPMAYVRANAVVLAAGGFEQSQAMRDRCMAVPTDAKWSLTPPGANVGDAIRAGEAIGAATEFMECAWWAPSMQLPARDVPNVDITHPMFFDHRHPHSVCVNRLGSRFVNESCSYDRFGIAMIEDHRRTGANVPCWMIFDATYRAKYACGGIMPSSVMPDRKIPPDWWDNYVYRADSIEALAEKLGLEGGRLARVIGEMNRYAATGVDLRVRPRGGSLRSLLRRCSRHSESVPRADRAAAVLCDPDRPGRSRHQRRTQGRRACARARSPGRPHPRTLRRGQLIRVGLRRLLPGLGRDSRSGADVRVHCRQQYSDRSLAA